jgi:PIN domain nuclease of toxin-antitoxin system
MRLLLDTHIMLSVVAGRPGEFGVAFAKLLNGGGHDLIVSVTSIWEAAIKWQLGKLVLERPPHDHPELLAALGIVVMSLEARHVLASYEPVPVTRDPFDRVLLSICRADDLKLVTADGALTGHPLAWRP